MDKPNRRIVWLHVTFEKSGDIYITFIVERWEGGKYKGKRRRSCSFGRVEWERLGKLLKLVRSHGDVRYCLPAYDGWSVCFETLFS